LNPIVQRKLANLAIGETVDLRPDGIPFSVERHGQIVYRIIPHEPDVPYQRIRCKTRETCLQKLAKALNLLPSD
jgi:hypothetical protein